MIKKFLKKTYPFLPIALVSLFFLFIMSGVADAWILDPFKASLEGVEEIVGPIIAFIIRAIFIYLKLAALLFASAFILDKVIHLNLEMVSVHSDIVIHGFDFVSGLVNMFLILIFIAIAFAIILKIESFQAKKVLPRLIIVAFLINFSLVFIGMLIDITNIIYNTLLPPGESLMGALVNPFIADGIKVVTVQIGAIATKAIAFAIPFTAPLAQAIIAVAFPTTILPAMIVMFLQMVIFVILILMFKLYIIIFAARIFIIQILAIFAPLAFLCLILPQTKKYWDMWLKWLFEWLFVGIFLLFLLRLGFFIFGEFRRGIDVGVPWIGNLGDFLMFYLFVVIYLGIVAFMAKKFMPEFVEAGISATKTLLTTGAIGAGLVMGKMALGKAAAETGTAAEANAEEIDAKKDRGEKLGLKDKATQGVSRISKWAYGLAGTTAQKKELEYAEEDAKKYENVSTEDLLKKAEDMKDPENKVAVGIELIRRNEAGKISKDVESAMIDTKDSDLINALAPGHISQITSKKDFNEQKAATKGKVIADEAAAAIDTAEGIIESPISQEIKKGRIDRVRDGLKVGATQARNAEDERITDKKMKGKTEEEKEKLKAEVEVAKSAITETEKAAIEAIEAIKKAAAAEETARTARPGEKEEAIGMAETERRKAEEAKIAARTTIKAAKEDPQKIDNARRIVNALSNKTDEEGRIKSEEERKKEVTQKVLSTTNPEKIKGIKMTPEVVGAMITNANISVHQITNFSRIHGAEFAKALQEVLKKQGDSHKQAKYLHENNPALANYMLNSPSLAIALPKDVMQELRNITKAVGKQPKEERPEGEREPPKEGSKIRPSGLEVPKDYK